MGGGQHPAKRAEYNRLYKAVPANMQKVRARDVVKRNLLAGKIVRQPCERCGTPKTHAHHQDYSKPLAVNWLCHPCHAAMHAGIEHERSSVVRHRGGLACKHGHPWTPASTWISPRTGWRQCRVCIAGRQARGQRR